MVVKHVKILEIFHDGFKTKVVLNCLKKNLRSTKGLSVFLAKKFLFQFY